MELEPAWVRDVYIDPGYFTMSIDGRYIAFRYYESSRYYVEVYNEDGNNLWSVSFDDISSVAFSKDGLYVALGITEEEEKKIRKMFKEEKKLLRHRYIVLYNRAGKSLWKYKTGIDENAIYYIDFSRNNTIVAASTKTTFLFDINGNLLWKKEVGGEVKISDDGKFIAVAKDSLVLLNEDGEVIWEQKLGGSAESLSMTPDASLIAVGADDGKVYLFSREGKLLWSYQTDGEVFKIKVSSDGKYVSAGSGDGGVYFLDSSGNFLWKHSVPKGGWYSRSLDISDNCNYIIVRHFEKGGGPIDVLYKTGTLVASFNLEPKVGRRILVASSSDGSRFAVLWYYAYKNHTDYSKLYFFDLKATAEKMINKAKSLSETLRGLNLLSESITALITRAEKKLEEKIWHEAYELAKKAVDDMSEVLKKRALKKYNAALALIKEGEKKGFNMELAKSYLSKADEASKAGNWEEAYNLSVKAEETAKEVLPEIVPIIPERSKKEPEKSKEPQIDQAKPSKELPKSEIKDFPEELLTEYEPLEFLGEGGFAKVFKAKRRKDGRIVALKIPRIDKKTSKYFIKEVSAWYNLNHRNIVKLYKADILPAPYLEMEYVEGVNLNGEIIRNLDDYEKPLEENLAINLIKGIAEGLKHAHSKGIYHLDLKPLNVLLKGDLTPKITDWGLAKVGARSSTVTATGALTLLYAAPEQLDEDTYGSPDHRTDIYQLGLIFYELLTGKLPYSGMTPAVIMGKVVNPDVKPKPPSAVDPKLVKYDGIFEKLLAKRKENRYQSIEEFLNALKSFEELVKVKKELEETKRSLKMSASLEDFERFRREAVQKTCKLALISAQLNDKAELLNALGDLKFYTRENLRELLALIGQVEIMLKEGVPIGESMIEGIKVLLHKIERENMV